MHSRDSLRCLPSANYNFHAFCNCRRKHKLPNNLYLTMPSPHEGVTLPHPGIIIYIYSIYSLYVCTCIVGARLLIFTALWWLFYFWNASDGHIARNFSFQVRSHPLGTCLHIHYICTWNVEGWSLGRRVESDLRVNFSKMNLSTFKM